MIDQVTENQLSALLEYSQDIIIVVDEDGIIAFVSPAITHRLGHDPEEMLGENAFDMIHPDDRDTVRERFSRMVEAPDFVTERIVHRLQHEDGSWVWVESIGSNRTDTAFDGYVINSRDITKRKEHKQELRQFRQAIETTAHAVYIVAVDGTIEYVNPAFEEITGYSAEEAVGKTPRILKSGQKSDDYYEELWETILSGEVWEEEITNRRKSEELYHALQTITPITDEEGTVREFVAVQSDITERKERERQLTVLDRVLRHNLHNDLNVIRGWAETIQDEATGELADGTHRIIEQSDQLLTTVDKERAITQALSESTQRKTIGACSLITQIVTATLKKYPNASIDTDLPEQAFVSAPENLGRAIEELLENAIIHHDQDSPAVRVAIISTDNSVRIRIADDGPGIPELERKIVTEEQEIEPLYHGRGLGLWLVYWIVRRSNGQLEFEENEPRGSVVILTLPRAGQADTVSARMESENQ